MQLANMVPKKESLASFITIANLKIIFTMCTTLLLDFSLGQFSYILTFKLCP
jgi:hypothetical protein